mmetsp:Transcript_8315/g.12856  ORF Transcript_8315/g.12856 Transcript_8315/m.12856 type:complete len:111 (-) Transcript_8315:306-638(-)
MAVLKDSFSDPSEFIARMKHGDLIEDVSVSGYRCDGMHHVCVSKTNNNKRRSMIRDLDHDLDDYGTPAWGFPEFSTTHFYLERAPRVGGATSQDPYWHSDEGYAMAFSCV